MKLIIDDFYNGWAPTLMSGHGNRAYPGARGHYTYSEGLSIFRAGFEGQLAPGEAFDVITDSTPHVNTLPLNFAASSQSSNPYFAVLQNGKLVNFGTSSVNTAYSITMAAAHAAHTLSTTSNNNDLLIVKDNAATTGEWVIWSWEDNTDADIACITTAGASQDNDWFSTRTGSGVLKVGVPHKLWLGPDKVIYCTNGAFIASATIPAATALSGATVAGNTQALELANGWIATSGCAYNSYNAIIAYRSADFGGTGTTLGEARLFLWDGYSPAANFVYTIDDNYVSAIHNDNGVLKITSSGRNNTTKIWAFNGQGLTKLYESKNIGQPPRMGSIESYRNTLYFGAKSSDDLYCLDGKALHNPHNITVSAGSTFEDIGGIKEIQSNTLHVGVMQTSGGTSYKILKINTGTYQGGGTPPIFRTRLLELPYKSTIKKITFYLSQFTTNSTFRASLMKDYDTQSLGGSTDRLGGKTFAQSAYGSVWSISYDQMIPDVSSFYLQITWNHSDITYSAAIIRKIEVEYEPSVKF